MKYQLGRCFIDTIEILLSLVQFDILRLIPIVPLIKRINRLLGLDNHFFPLLLALLISRFDLFLLFHLPSFDRFRIFFGKSGSGEGWRGENGLVVGGGGTTAGVGLSWVWTRSVGNGLRDVSGTIR